MKIRALQLIGGGYPVISLISNGTDIWTEDADMHLLRFRQVYLHQFSAIPTNFQFTERNVTESG